MSARPMLLVEADAARRRELALRLAELGREVIPAVTPEEALRFAAALGGQVALAAPANWEPGAAGGDLAQRALLYAQDLPPSGRSFDLAVRKLALGALQQELGPIGAELTLDESKSALSGDLERSPFLELVRALAQAHFSGWLVTGAGDVALAVGQVTAARAGLAHGVKAFSRLAQQATGGLRVAPGPPPPGREIRLPLADLILAALEDRLGTPPDLDARIRVLTGDSFFQSTFSPLERDLLGALQHARTVGALLDLLPGRCDGEILRALGELARRGVLSLEEPQAQVRVISDTASDLPAGVARAHGIRLIPYTLSFGGTFVRDREAISPAEFYRLLDESEGAPAIEPPGRGELLSVFTAGLETQNLVSVHAAQRLGSALDNARAAADDGVRAFVGLRAELDPVSIEVVDSRSGSLGQGLLAIAAARMAARGWSAPAIRRRLDELATRLVTLVLARCEPERPNRRLLDFFARSAEAWAVYEIADGELFWRSQASLESSARQALLALARARLGSGRPLALGIAHAAAADAADRIRADIARGWPVGDVVLGELGPPLGATFGAGAVLVALLEDEAAEVPGLAPNAG